MIRPDSPKLNCAKCHNIFQSDSSTENSLSKDEADFFEVPNGSYLCLGCFFDRIEEVEESGNKVLIEQMEKLERECLSKKNL